MGARPDVVLCLAMVMMMMMVVVSCRHHLRLRRDWSREAEESNESEQDLLHE
jgi:hypothetical protein